MSVYTTHLLVIVLWAWVVKGRIFTAPRYA